MTGIHHVALTVTDLERSLRFYTQVLGFRQGRWLRGPGGPSEIVFVEVPGGGRVELFHYAEGTVAAPPRRDNHTTGWNHVAFGVPDIDAAVQGLQSKGVTFTVLPAAKGTAPIRVAFFADPDGNTLELFEE